ncbi:MAG: alpha-D-ribose 1-methylphosphonate 5-triphosphate synthase subunit PhnH [Rhodospirillaceae bacterium]|jgi:alpha-D-ribose 1-methylphosphonate 5-triphosphate synthase subunit PhnH|nr:alpha-D-ribose 1-methylphosphonate 5-triphosphate synthase subunit PhnH [Rhodospirillaceae bacterium]
MNQPVTVLAPGFSDPGHDAQRLFRAVLDAFAHPGRIMSLPDPPAGPGTISPATAAYLLTLVDRDTPLWLAPEFERPAVRDFVRFHTGAPIVARRDEAVFAVLAHDTASLDGFAIGTDPYPDRSATLVIEVPVLGAGAARRWRGPGIDGQAAVAVGGLGADFWQAWADNHALFPCGVDVVFAAGSQLLALPRSIAVEG